MAAYDFKKVPALTAEEKKSPYAKFYAEPVNAPAAEIIKALQPGKQMDPRMALPPEDLNKLFQPGTLKVENGYCIVADGTGYSVIHSKLPGVTAEMERFWKAWIASNDYNYLNYKAVLPGMNFMYANPLWEDFGWGPVSTQVRTTVNPIATSSLPKQLNPAFYSLEGEVLTIVPDFNGKPYWATVVNYTTIDKKGEDIYTVIWHGTHIFNDTPVRMINKADVANVDFVINLTRHYAYEYARKAQILPKLYAYSKTVKK
jgi:phloretin hydrolase